MAEKVRNEVTTSALAEILGVTTRRVQQLAKEIPLKSASQGKYNLPETIQTYISWIKDKSLSDEELDLNKERALHEASKRKITEINLAKMERRMHDAKDVELVITEMFTNLRTQLLGLPAQVAGVLAGKSQEDIYQRLTGSIESKLLELSDYDSKMFDNEIENNEQEDD